MSYPFLVLLFLFSELKNKKDTSPKNIGRPKSGESVESVLKKEEKEEEKEGYDGNDLQKHTHTGASPRGGLGWTCTPHFC